MQIAAADSALENQDEDVDSVLYRVRAVDGFPSEKIVGKHTFKFVGGDDVVGVNTFALPFAITSPDIDTALDLVNVLDQKATVFGYWDNTNKKFVGAKKITYANGEVDDASAEVLGDINIQRGINYQVSVSDSVNLVVVGEI